MTKNEFFDQFRKAVSNERIDGYLVRGAAGGDENLVVHYGWNIRLCEALYPSLQCLEVALRNALHDALSRTYGREDWYDTPGLLNKGGCRKISGAKRELKDQGKPLDPPRVVAELTFGFWNSLFNAEYESKVFRRIAKPVFQGLPKYQRRRPHISPAINDIRQLRNRVFHHEPIWHWRDLASKHAKIIEVLSWINPAMAEFVVAIDQFPGFLSAGMDRFQAEVERKLPALSPTSE